MIRVAMSHQDVTDLDLTLPGQIIQPLRCEAGIGYGGMARVPVGQQIAEVPVSTQVDLKKMDLVVGVVVKNHRTLLISGCEKAGKRRG
jgi:hypothetical protein